MYKFSKVAIRQEAMRIAKDLVKEGIHRQGMKLSHCDPEAITKTARELVKEMPIISTEAEFRLNWSRAFTEGHIDYLTPRRQL